MTIRRPYNPHDDDTIRAPFPWYAELRQGPSAYHVEGTDIYVLSRYAEINSALKEPTVFSSTGGVGPDWKAQPMMSMCDPPEHTRLRRIVARAFTPRSVDALVPTITAQVDDLVTRLLRDGGCFVEDFAEPLVAGMIADLLGVPARLKPSFRRWSLAITSSLARNVSQPDLNAAETNRRELVASLRELIDAPADEQEGLIAVLSEAGNNERLTSKELVAFCVLLLVAGFETTVNGLSNGIHLLLTDKGARSALDRPPSVDLVDELLRVDPPVHAFFRNTLREVRFDDGSVIPAESKVMILFASANHDERVYDDPLSVRLDRGGPAPLSFGAGPHHCIGAALARTLYQIVYAAWRERCMRVALVGEQQRTHNTLMRGFLHLALRP